RRGEAGELDAVEATDVHVDVIGVRARDVEARHAAVATEMVRCRPGAEAIGAELVRACQEAELCWGDDHVQVGLAGADGAVALAHPAEIGIHLEAHPPAVAPAGIGLHGGGCYYRCTHDEYGALPGRGARGRL